MSATVANSVRTTIEKLDIKSGDTLVVRFPDGHLAHEATIVAQQLKENLELAGKSQINVIVLPTGWDIQELSTEDLDKIGLCRKENNTLN